MFETLARILEQHFFAYQEETTLLIECIDNPAGELTSYTPAEIFANAALIAKFNVEERQHIAYLTGIAHERARLIRVLQLKEQSAGHKTGKRTLAMTSTDKSRRVGFK